MSGHLQLAAAPIGARSGATPAIRVVLGDDHSLIRRGLRLLLEREEGVEVVAGAGDIPAAIRHVHWHRPNVLVLDLSTAPSSTTGLAVVFSAARSEPASGSVAP